MNGKVKMGKSYRAARKVKLPRRRNQSYKRWDRTKRPYWTFTYRVWDREEQTFWQRAEKLAKAKNEKA